MALRLRHAILLLFLLTAMSLSTAGSKLKERHQRLLSRINRPFVSTFNLSDGTVVDCVKLEEQLGLQHHRLKGHKILRQPSSTTPFLGSAAATAFLGEKRSPRHAKAWQLFHQEHGPCSRGTVPVRRLLPSDLERMHTPEIFLRKHPAAANASTAGSRAYKNKPKTSKNRSSRKQLRPPAAAGGHQYAIVQEVGAFSGSQAYLSVWDPAVATASDFSLSQLWVGAGAHGNINTVEAGWQVYELLNGDRSPHLFIFWTADGYKSSGCYNLRCPGFVQTSPNVLLGGAISTVSSPGDRLFFKKLLIFKDPVAWWLQIDDEWVGYWPVELFTTLSDHADWLQWGGEVCLSGTTDGPQLSTQMGSGFWPSDGSARAASQCQLAYLDDQMASHDALRLTEFSTLPQCYSARSLYDSIWGSHIIFGGQGCH